MTHTHSYTHAHTYTHIHTQMDERVANDKHTLVIDLGGTLVDSSADIAKAINLFLAKKGFDVELDRFQCGHMIGDGAIRLTSRALESVGMPGE